MPQDTPDQEFEETVSKSRRKRDMEALQDLGAQLVRLPADRLNRLDLPEELHAAVQDWHRFTKHEAKRRQLQFIGRLMRDIDADGIAEQLAEIRGESDAAKARFHALERWRTRLLEDDNALTQWLAQYPASDAQQLRQIIRNGRKEAERGGSPRYARELFKLLRDIQESAVSGHGPRPSAT